MSHERPALNTRPLPLRRLAIPPAPAPPIGPQLVRHGADAGRPVTSDQGRATVQEEDRQHQQPLDLSDEPVEPAKAVHAAAAATSSQDRSPRMDAVGHARDGR
jgi:hypothetical protein